MNNRSVNNFVAAIDKGESYHTIDCHVGGHLGLTKDQIAALVKIHLKGLTPTDKQEIETLPGYTGQPFSFVNTLGRTRTWWQGRERQAWEVRFIVGN